MFRCFCLLSWPREAEDHICRLYHAQVNTHFFYSLEIKDAPESVVETASCLAYVRIPTRQRYLCNRHAFHIRYGVLLQASRHFCQRGWPTDTVQPTCVVPRLRPRTMLIPAHNHQKVAKVCFCVHVWWWCKNLNDSRVQRSRRRYQMFVLSRSGWHVLLVPTLHSV